MKVKEPYIRLAYTYNGIEKNYQVFLSSMPSNLGKGKIYYFICPVNGSRCRKLYFCGESGIWQSRTAFKTRLYYPYQLSSKYNYNNDRFWSIERQLKDLYSRMVKSHYRGCITRLQLSIERMEEKRKLFDKLRWTKVPKGIQEMLDEGKMVQ